jgi:signal transduction histidine kinase
MAQQREARAWPVGGGELGALIRAHDWAATPLGPIAAWPQSLRVAVRLLLTTRHPMFIWWGPELIQLYNDAYSETMGPERHPSALGGGGRETWAEIWDTIGPQIADVMAGRGATWHEDQLVPVTRHGGRQDVWWTYGYSPIDDEAAEHGIGGVLVVCRDVTAEHAAAAALRAAHAATEAERARLHELFAQAPSAICLLSGPDHVYTLANPPYLALIGRDDILGRRVRDVLPELAGQGIIELLDGVYQTGTPFVGDEVLMRLDRDADGEPEEVYFTFVYAPFRATDGATEGIFVHAHEVTGQVRARLAAEAAVRARDTFLSVAAHELRTPLTTLKGTTQLLLRRRARGQLDADQLAMTLATLDQSADRLVALTDDLFDVARIRTGQLPLAPRPTDLAALAAESVAQARDRGGDEHRLSLDAPGGLPPVVADAGRIEQVLINLLDNAIKYSPAGGTVTVTLRAEGAGGLIAVRDQGIGLPAGAADAIFAPFGRAENAAASSLPGMGLGLYICRSIVERHGGWIAAESAGEGCGTTITFWLPLDGPSLVVGGGEPGPARQRMSSDAAD